MSEIEWLSRSGASLEGDVVDGTTVSIPEARALVVGPDDLLVIVFPYFLGQVQMEAHRRRLREVLGDRFILLTGDNIQLAKIPERDWATGAIDKE